MSCAYIETAGSHIRLESERLIVTPPRDRESTAPLEETSVPLFNLDRVMVGERVQITTQAVCALLRRGIPLGYLAWSGDFLGETEPPASQHSGLRLRQYERTRDGGFCLEVSRRLIAAKIGNQRRLLQRLNGSRERLTASEIAMVSQQEPRAIAAASPDELRGAEGLAAARFFALWARFLPEAFPFERRSTRPPLNAVNACLGYLAAIVHSELVSAIHQRGLEPGLGCLHVTTNYRHALALDLMEPFRPVVIEALTLRLFTLGIFVASDFESHEHGAVYLTTAGKRKLLAQYESRVEREFLAECLGHRTTVRQQYTEATAGFVAALLEPENLHPFRLN
jgi:CRISP-associated protein Cas1